MLPITIKKAKGVAIKELCEIAIKHELFCYDGAMVAMFRNIVHSFQPNMDNWVCAVAYCDGKPVGVLLGMDFCVSLFTKIEYRRFGVASQLIEDNKTDIPNLHGMSGRSEAIAFFRKLKIPNFGDSR